MLQTRHRTKQLDLEALARVGDSARGVWTAGLGRALAAAQEAPRVAGPKIAAARGVAGRHAERLRRARAGTRRRTPRTKVVVGAASAVAAGGGALLMYFLDPDRGRSRRIRSRDHVLGVGRRATRRTLHTTTRVARYNAGKIQGATHMLRSAVPNGHHPQIDDATITDKIRSEVLGRGLFSAMDIHVDCYRGVAHLRGQVSSEKDVKALVTAVGRVSGVVGVESFLHAPGQIAPNKASVFAAEASGRNAAAENGRWVDATGRSN